LIRFSIFANEMGYLRVIYSRTQQQAWLPIRYLKIGYSSQSLYYKAIRNLFQNYEKTSKVCPFRLKKREDQKPFSHNDKNTYLCSMSEDTYKTIIYPQQSSRYRKIKEMKYEN